ncbi:MAG: molybdopterin molybdenumtransferase MoeA [Rhodospirillales bacterium CG15_BIG_FIL_POST_REV_8_21_14_020_66_15]|nr:MAG: molybdopterin molybdenumtransferase MoeA [Rhodospirillales bacterium CG15_BIG_FIL_POST_REV_8_21_14_020_66_15]
MLSVIDALAKVSDGVSQLPAEQVALGDALGRVLARDVASTLTHPPVAVSAMDGYAVRWDDLGSVPAPLTVIGESAAGHGLEGTVGPGQAARIFTGAALPAGADTIVIQEDTERDGETVRILENPKEKGEFVRPAGLDFAEGEVLLKAGHVVTARGVGLAAAMNVPWLMVRRRPRVAFVATGDEVVMPGQPVGPGQIISSNSLALAAYVTAMGGEPVSLGIARDTPESLAETLAGARGADLLVTMGGASVGDHDLVRQVLGGRGFELDFYKIAMRPGKPLIFGHIDGTPLLGLPGNPVSTGVTSALFLRAAFAKMLGLAGERTECAAVLGGDLPANGRREDYMRASLETGTDGRMVATAFPRQDSAMLAAFTRADCLIVRPVGAPPAKAGDLVRILPLGFGVLRF